MTIRYRPFLNSDPPALAEVWRSYAPARALAQPMSAALLEQYVFAKPYFDAHGFIVAEDDGRPVGFVHGSWLPKADFSDLDPALGVVCILMVAPHEQRTEIAASLLRQCESYLVSQGAQSVAAPGGSSLGPFYLGLYGGSRVPGVTADDPMLEHYIASGYTTERQRVLFQRNLAGFRPVVDRVQMQLRRTYNVQATFDPECRSWYEACTIGQTEQIRFHVLPKRGGDPVGYLDTWDMEPLASSWGVHASGFLHFEIEESLRGRGLATFLLGESLRQLQSQKVTLVAAQCRAEDQASLALYRKLGFQEQQQSQVMVKSLCEM